MPVVSGGTVLIIRCPLGISVSCGWPVWKSGCIASEPHFHVTLHEPRQLTTPTFFVDAQTRTGVSGSPELTVYIGSWNSDEPYAWDGDDPSFL